jgi:hypothetical protein
MTDIDQQKELLSCHYSPYDDDYNDDVYLDITTKVTNYPPYGQTKKA